MIVIGNCNSDDSGGGGGEDDDDDHRNANSIVPGKGVEGCVALRGNSIDPLHYWMFCSSCKRVKIHLHPLIIMENTMIIMSTVMSPG